MTHDYFKAIIPPLNFVGGRGREQQRNYTLNVWGYGWVWPRATVQGRGSKQQLLFQLPSMHDRVDEASGVGDGQFCRSTSSRAVEMCPTGKLNVMHLGCSNYTQLLSGVHFWVKKFEIYA